MSFPSAVLKVVSYGPGTLLGANPLIGAQELDQASGSIRLSLARIGTTQAPTAPGGFLVVRFQVKPSTPVGSHQVSVSSAGLADENFGDLTVTLPGPAIVTVN